MATMVGDAFVRESFARVSATCYQIDVLKDVCYCHALLGFGVLRFFNL